MRKTLKHGAFVFVTKKITDIYFDIAKVQSPVLNVYFDIAKVQSPVLNVRFLFSDDHLSNPRANSRVHSRSVHKMSLVF